ncbi:MAG: hypothetical protein ABFC84_06420, partial [Veillonellales bacterium]
MKIQRKWRRAWSRGKPSFMSYRRKQKVHKPQRQYQARPRYCNKLLARKIAAALLVGMFWGSGSLSFAAEQIVIDGKTHTSLTIKDKITDVTTTTISKQNAFNSFTYFNVFNGNTVNLYLPGGTSNLLNFVHGSRSQIDGMLNSIKDNRIGGNVYFLNPYGMVVGASGAVNVGSLSVITPTKPFMDNLFDKYGNPSDAGTAMILNGSVPVDANGFVTVQGKVNAVKDIRLAAGTIVNSGTIMSGAAFKVNKPNFSDVVNVRGLDGAAKVSTENGVIEIVAAGDITNSGIVATDGAANLAAGTITIKAGQDINLQSGSVISAKGNGVNSAGGRVDSFAGRSATFADGAIIDVRGGTTGDGGSVEFSAKDKVTLAGGEFRAWAEQGKGGSILVDPNDVEVVKDNQYTQGANYSLIANNSITVAQDITISTRQVDGGISADQMAAASVGNSGKLTLEAPNITLNSGSRLLAHATGVYAAGDITLNATDLLGNGAAISLTGATVKGGNVSFNAASTYSNNAILGIDSKTPSATIDVKDSSIVASGDVNMKATVNVDITANTPDFLANLTGDSAFAGATVDSTARVKLDGTTDVSAAGAVSLAAKNTVDLTVSAKAADNSGDTDQTNSGNNAGGGSLGFGVIHSTTEAGIAGQTKISQSQSIDINAFSSNAVTTEAISSVRGAQAQTGTDPSETQKKLTEYQDDAKTSDGSVTVAAALGINDITSVTKAYMESAAASTSTGQAQVTSNAVNQSAVTADGSAVEAGATGVGVAVGINKVSSDNKAYVNQTVETSGLSVKALMNKADNSPATSSLTTNVSSGAGADNVGVAGALAVNVNVNESNASIGSLGNIQTSGNVNIAADNRSVSTANALPSGTASGDKVGVGASVAVNIGINHVAAEIEDSALITGANDVSLAATGSHTLTTEAKAGSAGNISVTPVVALTIADNQASAKVGSGDPLNITGDLTVKADNAGSSTTTAEGQADGEKAAVGIAIGLTVAVDEAEATTKRDIRADGGVSFQADNASAAKTDVIASAAGGKAAKDDGSVQDGDKDVNKNVQDQTTTVANKDVIKDKASDKAKASLAAPPKAETSEGSVSVAAAVGVNIGVSSAKAYTPDGIAITSGKTLELKTTSNSAAAATAEGKAVSKVDTDGNKVGVGAAVAVNVATVTNEAKLGAAKHNVKGLEISAAMRDVGTVEQPDKVSNFSAQATSGAGGSKVGIAGSVAINTVVNSTTAEVASDATVDAGSGAVVIRAENQSDSEAKALPTKEGVTGGKVGIGASVAINTVVDNVKADIDKNANLTKAGALSVVASSDSDTNTEATGGAAGGVAIDAVAAVTTLNQTTQATIDTGSQLDAASIEVRSTNSGDHTATATGDTKSDSVGIGASAAVITSNGLISATINRDVVSAGDITIAASADRSYEAVATASSKGAKGLDDGETAPSDPKNVSSKALKDTADKQEGTSGGKKVDVAAAVGVSVINDDVDAGITGGADSASKRLVSTGGKLSVTADTTSDFSSRGSGAALDPTAKAGIGVGVGISVALNDTTASIGDNTTVKAKGDVNIAAVSLQNKSDSFVNKLSAEGVAGAGGDKVGVAGALAVAYSQTVTQAAVGNNVSITGQNGDGIINTADDKAGNITVTTDNTSKLSAKAWSIALSQNAGVGASVATIVSDNQYVAAVGSGGVIDAESLNLQAYNHKVTGPDPFEFNTEDPQKLKESLTAKNLQSILGQNNYYTEAIAGSASGKVAVTGAAAVDYFQDQTKASIGSGTTVSTSDAVTIESSSDTTAKAFVTSVALSSGNAGVGLVSTDIINSSETSSIFAGDINQSGSVSVTADAKQDVGVFGLGGGVANTAGIAGVATAAVSENKAYAQVVDNAEIDTTGNLTVHANNDFNALNVAASVAVGGTAGIGAAIGTTNVQDDTQAWIGKNVAINAGQDTSVTAAAAETLHTIAAGGAGGGTAGVAGSAVVETVIVDTTAFIDQGTVLTGGKNVNILASDDTTIASFGGAVSFGGTTGVGAGAVVEVIDKDTEASIKDSESDKKTIVHAGENVVTQAQSTESITAAAASAAGGGTAGVAGSGVVYVITDKTNGYIGDNAQVHAGGSAVASASDDTTMNLLAGNVAVGGTAGVGGAAGVSVITKTTDAHIGNKAVVQADGDGDAVQVANGKFSTDSTYVPGTNEIAAPENDSITEAPFDQIDIPGLTKPVVAQKQDIHGVGVSAVSRDTVRTGAVGASGGGTAGVQGSLGANVIVNTTKAHIDTGAVINTADSGEQASQSVLVAAGSDFHRLAMAGAFAGGGTAGVGGGTDLAVRVADTEAYIAETAQVMAQKDIAVTANAAESIFSVTAVGAVGINAGVAGSLAGNVLTNTTKAYIEEADTADAKAVVKAGNNVRLAADDDTNIAVIAGGAGFSINGAGVGGSADVNVITKDTQAYVGKNAEVEALGGDLGATQTVYAGTDNKTQAEGQRASKSIQGLAVQAASTENVIDGVVAGGGSLYAGVAGTVVANVISADTAAYIDDNAKITAKDVSVTAVDDLKLFSAAGSAGVGAGGVAGSFNVGVIVGDTTAYIGAADVTADNDVDVNALATKDIHVNTVSAGGGVVGIAGSVSVLAIGGGLTDEALSYLDVKDKDGKSTSAQGDTDSKVQDNKAESMIGSYTYTYKDKDGTTKNIGEQAGKAVGDKTAAISVSSVVANKTIPVSPLPHGTAAVIREGAKINAGGDAAVNARDNLQLQSAAGSVAGGAGAFGAAANIGVIDHLTDAHIGSTAAVNAKGDTVVNAAAGENLNTVGVAGSAGGTAISGAINLNVLHTATKAHIDQDAVINETAYSGKDVIVKASDATAIVNIGGAASIGGSGVGAGLGIDVITKDTQAYIGSATDSQTTVNADGSILVDALSDEQITNVSASGAAGGGSVAGAGAVETLNATTKAFVGDSAVLTADGSIRVAAEDDNTMNLIAGSAVGGLGAGGSVGAAVITKDTEAYIDNNADVQANASKSIDAATGKFTEQYAVQTAEAGVVTAPSLNTDDKYLSKADNKDLLTKFRTTSEEQDSFSGVAVTAMSKDSVANEATGGVVGTGAAIAGSVTVVTNTTNAYVDNNARINQHNTDATAAGQDVRVAAGSDYYHLGIGGVAIVGAAALGPGADISVVKNETEANVGTGASMTAKDNMSVTADSSETILSTAVAGAASASLSVAGAVVVNSIDNTTLAHIDGSVAADNNVLVAAADDTEIKSIAGSAALGVGIAGVGASIDVNHVTKTTEAYIADNAKVDAKANASGQMTVFDGVSATNRVTKNIQGVAVRADSTEDIFTVAASGAVGAFAGAAGSAAANVINVNTGAHIGDADINTLSGAGSNQSVSITAADDLKLFSVGGSVAGGAVGAAGGVDIGIINTDTSAYIANGAAIQANKMLDVNALSTKDIDSYAASASGGLVGVAGGVSVYSIGTGVGNDAKSSLTSSNGVTAQQDIDNQVQNLEVSAFLKQIGNSSASDAATNISAATSNTKVSAAVEQGIASSRPTFVPGGTTALIGNNVRLNTGSVSVNAKENLDFYQLAGSGALGGASIGGAVGIASINADTTASIGTGTVVTTSGGVAVNAKRTHNLSNEAYAGQAGLVAALGAATLYQTDASDTVAHFDGKLIKASDAAAPDLAVSADASDSFSSRALNASVSIGGALGAAVIHSNLSGSAIAYLGDGAEIGKQQAVQSAAVTANAAEFASAYATAGAGGGIAGSGSDANIVINTTADAHTGDNVTSKTVADLKVASVSTEKAQAQADGLNVGLLSVGASLASTDVKPTITATIGSANDIEAKDLSVTATQLLPDSNVTAKSYASAAGGGLIGVNATQSTANLKATVSSSVGEDTALNIRSNTTIIASNNESAQADVTGIVGGLIAIGANSAQASTDSTTAAMVEDGVSGNIGGTLQVSAVATEDTYADAVSGSGGLVAGTAAKASTINSSTTKAELGGGSSNTLLAANTIAVDATHRATFNSKVDSTNAALVGASGAAAVNTVNSQVDAGIRAGANLTALNINVLANNIARKPLLADNAFNVSAGAGGLLNGSAASSQSTITDTTQVTVGNNARITITGDPDNPGQTNFTAVNDLDAHDQTKLDSGGAIAIAKAESIITAPVLAQVTIGSGASMNSVGTINLGARTNATVDTDANAKTYGLAGAAQGASASTVASQNKIIVGDNTYFRANGDINLLAGRDGDGVKNTINASARTDLFNKTLLPVSTSPGADALITQNNTISVGSGANVLSVGDINLITDKGAAVADGQGVGKDLYRQLAAAVANAFSSLVGGGEVSLDIKGGTSKTTASTGVVVDGALHAGIQNKQRLVLNDDPRNDSLTEANSGYYTPIIAEQTDGVTFTAKDENLVSNAFTRLDNLFKLRTAYAKDPTAYAAYDSEINYIYQELVSLGYAQALQDATGNTVYVALKNVRANYVTLDDIKARSGDITVQADYLSGSGSLKAPNDTEITIINNSRSFLRVNDLTIEDKGGKLIFNGGQVSSLAQINDRNLSGSPSASFSSIEAAGSGATPKITIQNTYSPISGVAVPDIELVGNISNPTGTIMVQNNKGSIKLLGQDGKAAPSIVGNTVNISAGRDVVQSYVDGIYNVGGDPQSIWASEQNSAEAGKTDTTSNAYKAGTGSTIAGNNVYLSARYLNINGTIQSGIPDWDVTLDTDLNARIDSLKQQWIAAGKPSMSNSASLTSYRLSDGGNGKILAYFNPETNQIVLDAVKVQGGYAELSGIILNTGGGNIKVLDGYGRINVTNNTGYDIVLNGMDTGNIEGKVRITDTGKSAQDETGVLRPVVTTITRVGSDVQTVQTAGNKQLSDQVTANSRSSSYAPQSGLDYVWNRGQAQNETREITKKSGSWAGLISWKDATTISDVTVPSGPITNLPNGTYVTQTGQSANYSYDYKNVNTAQQEKAGSYSWSESHGWWIFGWTDYFVKDTYVKGSEDIHTHSVKADFSIPVSFIGYDSGQINVTSKQNLIVAGPVRNLAGTTTLSADKAISATAGLTTITSPNITLTAGTGIGSSLTPVAVQLAGNSGALTATSANGNIYLGSSSGDVRVNNISATNGNVSLTADGSILQAAAGNNAVITGNRIDLVSASGGIGSTGSTVQALNVNIGSQDGAGLNATAAANINIRQASGDMRLIRVESAGGDVSLEVANGSMIDANPEEKKDTRTIAQLQALWDNMLLTGTGATTSADNTVKAYKQAKQAEYQKYWQMRNVRATYDANGNITGYQADDYSNPSGDAEYQRLHAAYGNTSYNPSWVYVLTDSEKQSLTQGSAWTENELNYALSSGILFKQTTSTETRIKDPNVKGRNITLKALNGSIGKDSGSIVIDGTNPDALKNDDARIALAAAESDDVSVDNDTKQITILNRLPINISVTANGTITAEGKNNVYLGSQDPIYVKTIKSGDSIRVKGKDGIYNVATAGEAAIQGNRTILEGGDSGIGTKADPLLIDLGELSALTARAGGNIYITEKTGNLNVAEMYSTGDIVLRAAGSILDSRGDRPMALEGENVSLFAEGGSVGTGDNPFTLTVNPSGKLTASSADGYGIFVQSTANILNVGDLTSGQRLFIDADGQLVLKGVVNANSDITLTGEAVDMEEGSSATTKTSPIYVTASDDATVNNLKTTGSVYITSTGGKINQLQKGKISAQTLAANSKEGQNIAGANSVSNFSAANTGTGDIVFANAVDLLNITGINQNSGNVTVTNTGALITEAGGTVKTTDGNISLTAAGGSETINGTVNAGKTGTVTLTATGAASDVAVNGTVGSAGGAIDLVAAQDVLVNAKVNGMDGDITAQAGRDITINSDVETTGSVSLSAGRTIAETDSGKILDAALLTTDSVTGQKLNQANTVKTFEATNQTKGDIEFTNASDTLTIKTINQANGKVDVTNAKALITEADGTVKTTDGNISLTAADGSETINGTVNAGKTGTVTLTAAGAASDVAVNGTVTSAGGAIKLAAAQDVLVNGKVSGTDGDITAQAGRDITINSDVQTIGNVSLTAGGAIDETDKGRILDAALLTTDSVNGQKLNQANTVKTFQAANKTTGDIELTNTAETLTIKTINQANGSVDVTNTGAIISVAGGTVKTADGAISLTATGGSETVNGTVSAGGTGTVTLTATGAASDVAVNGTVTSDGGAIKLVADQDVLVNAKVSGADGDITAQAGRDVTINNDVETTGSVSLSAGRAIDETDKGRILDGALLTTESVTGQNLNQANTVKTFQAVNKTKGDIEFTNASDTLTIKTINQANGKVDVANTGAIVTETGGTVRTTDGAISLTATGGSETVNGTVNAGGTGTVTLTATGAESNMAVNGTVTSDGGAIELAAAQDVLVNAKVSGTNGDITAQAGRDITLSNDVQTTGKVSLNAGRAIDETDKGRILDAALLTTDSVNGQNLNQANTVKTFQAVNKTKGDIEFTNASDTLTIKTINQANGKVDIANTGAIVTETGGTVRTTDGAISLKATGGSETVNGTVSAGKTGTVTLTATGAASDVAVNGTVTSDGGAIELAAAQDVLVNAKVSGDSGDITAQADRDITINNDVQTTGNVNLSAGGAIAETDSGKILEAALLTADSVKGQNLKQANTVHAFNAGNSGTGDIEFTNAADTLTIKAINQANGKVDVTNAKALITEAGGTVKTTDGAISLTAAGGSETINGTVSAGKTGTVTLTAVGAASDVAVNGTVASAGGAIKLAAAQDVLVNGKVNGTDGDITAQADRDIILNSDVQTTDSVSLSAGRAIAETAQGRISDAALLTTDSVAGQKLAQANTVKTFEATNQTNGDIEFTNAADTLTIKTINQANGKVDVTNAKALITEAGGTVKTTDGNISLTAADGSETINGTVNAGGTGTVTLTATGAESDVAVNGTVASAGGTIELAADRDIILNSDVETTGKVGLTAGSAIAETDSGKILDAALLTTDSVAGQELKQDNTVHAFNAGNSGTGDIEFTNTSDTLTIKTINQANGKVDVTNAKALITEAGGTVKTTDGNISLT